MNIGKRLIRNSGWNAAAFVVTLLSQLVTLRFAISWIGAENFGQATLIVALWLPTAIFGAVISQSVIREMSANGQADTKRSSEIFTSAILICLLTTIASALALYASTPLLSRVFRNMNLSSDELRALIAVTSIGFISKQTSLVYQGAYAAQQRFSTIASVATIAAIATTIATLGITYFYPSTTGYLIGITTSFTLHTFFWIIISPNLLATSKPFELLKSKAMAGIVSFGKWQLAAQTLGAASNQADRYSLGALANAYSVGQYSAASRLQEALYMGILKLSEVLLPHFGATSSDTPKKRHDFYLATTWIVLSISVAIFAPAIPLAGELLRFVMGDEAGPESLAIFTNLIIASILGCASNIFTTCAMGLGHSSTVAALITIQSTLGVLLTVLLVSQYGIQAAGLGLALANFVRLLLSIAWTKTKLFPNSSSKGTIASVSIPVLTALAAAFASKSLLPASPNTSTFLVSYAVLSTTTLVLIILAAALTQSGQQTIRLLQSSTRPRLNP